MFIETKIRTYGLQVVVFLSFLALFSLIIAGIVFYGYQSNLEIMLKSSDELLYQISETITRQIDSHLEPANKNGIVIKKLLETNAISSSTVDFNEKLFIEALETYPQFQSIYFGFENGNYFMTSRDLYDIFVTKILTRTSFPWGIRLITRDSNQVLISNEEQKDLSYDIRYETWFTSTKNSRKTLWTTTGKNKFACIQPLFDEDNSFLGVIGIDFTLIEIDSFLKTLKIGEEGMAFICNEQGDIISHPAKANNKKIGKRPQPKSPIKVDKLLGSSAESNEESSAERYAINYYKENYDNKEFKILKFNFDYKSERYIALFRPIKEKFGKERLGNQWTLGIIVPEENFIGSISRVHETTLLFSFWLLVIAGFLTATLAKEITEPIHKAIQEANRIQTLNFEGEVDLQSPITEIQNMSDTMNSMKKALSAFKKYVPFEIVRDLVTEKNDAKLEAQSNKITILFTDIADFSSISEETNPRELVAQLSEYFDLIAKIIHNHNGTIDKYIGDSVMAFWGAPIPNDNQAKEACFAALEIEKSIQGLNSKWMKEGKKAFFTRIGINTGVSLIGNFGSSERFNYTAVGDSVNVASRLEGLNKVYGSQIIVSESTEKEAGNELIFRVLDIVAVKGRQQSITIYQLLGSIADYRSRILVRLSEMSERALVHYLSREWIEAEEKYKIILEHYPEDKTAKMFIERCKKLRENPLDNNWDGVYRLTQK